MNLNEYTSTVKRAMLTSPIRRRLLRNENIPVKDVKIQLDKNLLDLNTIEDNIDFPLKVALMGEVKAGKSTLVNCIIGSEISPTDVIESTSAIIEFYYCEKEEASIVKNDGSSIDGSLKEIQEIMLEHRGDLEFYSQCKYIKFGVPLKNLKQIRIIDTPGLATITDQNSKKTEEFIQECDVILWIYNGNQLGQEDIDDLVAEVAKLGKPIIAVINRIDEVDSSPEKLVTYLKQRMDIYLKEIFAISAFNAYKGIQSDNQCLIDDSGYSELILYILNNIEKKSPCVHQESILSSIKALLYNEEKVHSNYIKTIEYFKKLCLENREKLEFHKHHIMEEIKNDLYDWAERKFLMNELNEIHKIKKVNILKEKAEEIINEENLLCIVGNKLEETSNEFNNLWKEAFKNIEDYMTTSIIEFSEQFKNDQLKNEDSINIFLNSNVDEVTSMSKIMSGMKDGAIQGSAWGATLAVYTAVLGPQAAFIGIGSALVAWLPPALLLGVVTGVVAKIISSNKEHKELILQIDNQIEAAREYIRNYTIRKVIKDLECKSEEIVNNFEEKFVNSQGCNMDINELADYQLDITNYCNNIHQLCGETYNE